MPPKNMTKARFVFKAENGESWEEIKELTSDEVTSLKEELEGREEYARVVRCKDCKHRFEGEKFPNCCEVLMEMSQWLVEIPVKDEWHCGSGERKEE